MAAIPPKTNIDGLQASAKELIYSAFNRGVKYGRYLERQEQAAEKRRLALERAGEDVDPFEYGVLLKKNERA